MKVLSGAIYAMRGVATIAIVLATLSCKRDPAPDPKVVEVAKGTHALLQGASGVPARVGSDGGLQSGSSAGASVTYSLAATVCTPTDAIDSLPDAVDEDCDGLVDEDVDHRRSECPGGYTVIEGTRGDDVLTGTSARNCILGYGGNDVIRGGNGDDLIFGGPGDDEIDPGNGKDTVYGGDGDDDIDCGNGKDAVVYAGAGNDIVRGGNGKDILYGGDGNDHLQGGNGKDELYGEGCNDLLDGGAGKDLIVGGDGYDACDESGCEVLWANRRSCTPQGTCSQGVCAEFVNLCVPESFATCNACMPTAAVDLTCNGVDDDCDRLVDDDFVSTATQCGVGACASIGLTQCANGQMTDTCTPTAPAQNDTSCDGRDQNCDGAADEGFVPTATQCGVGACASTGQAVCLNAQVQNTCVPKPAAATDSQCDGIDEDCDSQIDEDFAAYAIVCGVGACRQELQAQCLQGQVQTCPSQQSCEGACEDGLDNDFDTHADCSDSDCAGEAACLIGQGCTRDADCQGLGEAPAALRSRCDLEVPGGYCVRPCDAERPDKPCPQGTICSPAANECVLPCRADGTCQDEAMA